MSQLCVPTPPSHRSPVHDDDGPSARGTTMCRVVSRRGGSGRRCAVSCPASQASVHPPLPASACACALLSDADAEAGRFPIACLAGRTARPRIPLIGEQPALGTKRINARRQRPFAQTPVPFPPADLVELSANLWRFRSAVSSPFAQRSTDDLQMMSRRPSN
jgi:hypothetical protein